MRTKIRIILLCMVCIFSCCACSLKDLFPPSVSARNMDELYKKFLQGEIKAKAVYDRDTVLSFYEEETYWEIEENAFPKEVLKKYFALVDVNGDKEEELIFWITADMDELMYILGCIDGELVAYDVFETHTTHMSFSIWDNGIAWWGQNYTGEEDVYFTYGKDGAAEELIHFVSTPEWLETVWAEPDYYYEYYYESGNEDKKVYLHSAEEYAALISKYQGRRPKWFDLSDFCDVSVLR